jgi:hypothetical protein
MIGDIRLFVLFAFKFGGSPGENEKGIENSLSMP